MKMLDSNPTVLALCIGLVLASGQVIGLRRAGKGLSKLEQLDKAFHDHLSEMVPIIQEHNKMKTELESLKKMSGDIKLLLLATSKIAAKLDIEVDL